jgi:hypothetical protein
MKETDTRWLLITLGLLGVVACGDLKDIAGMRDAGNCECALEDGPCCDGCNPYQASDYQVCETAYDYTCEGSNCGDAAQRMTGTKKCQGQTSACTGDLEWGNWEALDRCNAGQLCHTDEESYAECSTCEHGCNVTDCYPVCNPSDNCCTTSGTWRRDCANDCNTTTGECNRDCYPSNSCCESDGTWKAGDEVLQPETNLYWLRCPLEQHWLEGSSCGCDGTTSGMTWCDASGNDAPKDDGSGEYWCLAGYPGVDTCKDTYPGGNYRLPTGLEFSVLLEESAFGNQDGLTCDGTVGDTMCTDMFGLETRSYWSSTPYGVTSAWLARFLNGLVNRSVGINSNYVRCLRDGSEVDAGL